MRVYAREGMISGVQWEEVSCCDVLVDALDSPPVVMVAKYLGLESLAMLTRWPLRMVSTRRDARRPAAPTNSRCNWTWGWLTSPNSFLILSFGECCKWMHIYMYVCAACCSFHRSELVVRIPLIFCVPVWSPLSLTVCNVCENYVPRFRLVMPPASSFWGLISVHALMIMVFCYCCYCENCRGWEYGLARLTHWYELLDFAGGFRGYVTILILSWMLCCNRYFVNDAPFRIRNHGRVPAGEWWWHLKNLDPGIEWSTPWMAWESPIDSWTWGSS